MNTIGRFLGLAAGVAATALGAAARAEPNDGVAIEFAASAAEIDLMSARYGAVSDDNVEGWRPLVAEDGRDAGERFDARLSGLDGRLLGRSGEVYLRASHQEATGSGGRSFSKEPAAEVLVPTGFVDFDLYQSVADDGDGTIIVERDVEQRETEIAAGFVFATDNGFAPRIELEYRRREIDQTITVDRLGVTPMLEEFATDNSTLESDCVDLSVGLQKTWPLAASWSFVADASAGVGYCSHERSTNFDFETQIGNPYTVITGDSHNAASVRGALNAALVWSLSDMIALGFNAYARGESGAAYIAYPTYTFGGDVESNGDIRVDTESRASYGAGVSLRVAFE